MNRLTPQELAEEYISNETALKPSNYLPCI